MDGFILSKRCGSDAFLVYVLQQQISRTHKTRIVTLKVMGDNTG